MFSCGMYDYSGGWTYEVGIPAKSGVGGGILGVVNRQLGIGTYSPRLDRNGNSVRGIDSFKMMSNVLGLHAFDLTNTGSAFVTRSSNRAKPRFAELNLPNTNNEPRPAAGG